MAMNSSTGMGDRFMSKFMSYIFTIMIVTISMESHPIKASMSKNSPTDDKLQNQSDTMTIAQARVCMTQVGICPLSYPVPPGYPCTCYTPWGVFGGIAR
jgi:hypothetical protein